MNWYQQTEDEPTSLKLILQKKRSSFKSKNKQSFRQHFDVVDTKPLVILITFLNNGTFSDLYGTWLKAKNESLTVPGKKGRMDHSMSYSINIIGLVVSILKKLIK